jgi:hypothetical protein
VDDLRRDLRLADEDLFRLEAALKTRGGDSWVNARTVGVTILLAVGLGSVLSVANAPAVTTLVLPAVAAQPMLESAVPVVAAGPLAIRVHHAVSSDVKPVPRQRLVRRTARPLAAPLKATRHTPRPLSPGEFGRPTKG